MGQAHQHRPDQRGAAQLLQHLGGDRGGVERRHDQHVGGVLEAAERVLLQRLAVEGHVGRHVAVVLEVHASLVENSYRLAHLVGAFAARVPEGGVGEHGDARVHAEALRHARGLLGDVGELPGVRHVGDAHVRHQHRAPADQRDRHADHAAFGLGVEHQAHVVVGGVPVARDARHHAVGVAHGHHAGAVNIAVVVDQALAVAQQVALALQARVEVLGVLVPALVAAGVVRLDRIGELQARRGEGLSDVPLAADQDGLPEPQVEEGVGGARNLRLLALGEDDALGCVAHLLDDVGKPACHRVEPAGELGRIPVHVDDRAARHAGLHGRLGDGEGHAADEPRVERRGDDVVGPVFHLPAQEGDGDLVGHLLARQLGERVGGGDLHGLVDGGGLHVQRAAEDEGKAQHVVDLVRIIGAPRGHDGIVAHLGHILGRDLRVRVGHGEDEGLGRHRPHHVLGDRAGGGEAEERVGAFERVGERARLGVGGVGRLPLVHALLAAAPDHALGVAQHHVLLGHAHGDQQLHAGDGGRARAVDHELEILDVPPGQLQRVHEAGGGNDGGAVLVVVEHRDVEQLLEPLLDDEAVRCLDVLQVDAAEAGPQVAHAVDEGLHVLGIDQEVDAVDVGEALEEGALALHHRLGRLRPEVAEPQDGCAVGDHRHQVALVGVVVGRLRVLGYGEHRHRDARGVGKRQVALGGERLGRGDLELARLALGMELQRFFRGPAGCVKLDGHLIPLRQLRSRGNPPNFRAGAEFFTLVGSAQRHNVPHGTPRLQSRLCILK